MSEKSNQNYILKKLRQIPNSWWVKPTTTNLKGCPDIIGCMGGATVNALYRGKMITIEVKSDTGKPSPSQEYQGKLIEKAGGCWILASHWKFVDVIINDMRSF